MIVYVGVYLAYSCVAMEVLISVHFSDEWLSRIGDHGLGKYMFRRRQHQILALRWSH